MSEYGRDYWDAAVSMTPVAHKYHSLRYIASPYEFNSFDITVLVYCRNNEDTILDTLAAVVEVMGIVEKSFEILVMDDVSTDHSVEMVRGFMTEFSNLSILLRSNKKLKGLARNYYDGAFIGKGRYYRMVLGDNAESMETLVDIFRSIGDADIVVPYYVSMNNGGAGDGSSRFFTWFINTITGNTINCYGTEPLHLRYNVMRWRSHATDYTFRTNLLCRLLGLGFTCKQVPCRSVPQRDLDAISPVKKIFALLHITLGLMARKVIGDDD